MAKVDKKNKIRCQQCLIRKDQKFYNRKTIELIESKTEIAPGSGSSFKVCQFLVPMVTHVSLQFRLCLLWWQWGWEVLSGAIKCLSPPKLPPHSYTHLKESNCISPENESLLPNLQSKCSISKPSQTISSDHHGDISPLGRQAYLKSC